MSSPSLFTLTGSAVTVGRARAVKASIGVPGSKSLTNRYLLLAAQADGWSSLHHPLDCEDTRLMMAALQAMGALIECKANCWRVRGGHLHAPKAPLYTGNAGTVMRFLTPLAASFEESVVLDGSDRMRARPIRDLGDALAAMGVEVNYLERDGYPPISVRGPIRAGEFDVRGQTSSQYLSGLLMTLPRLGPGVCIRVQGALVSQTYVDMTLACLERFGVTVRTDGQTGRFWCDATPPFSPSEILVDPDASTASYWFALPLMIGGEVCVQHISQRSHQGDLGWLDNLRRMGARVVEKQEGIWVSNARLHGIDTDMNTMSDVAATQAVVSTMARSPSLISGVGHMRVKECDRIQALQTAFDQLGLKMESGSDWMRVFPGATRRHALLDPQDDHRMVMAFTLLGLAHGGVTIRNPTCVSKTYPSFFDEFERVLKPVG